MNAPVLVLNANFEPLNVCNTRRAIGLILTGKADLVVNGRGVIRTVSQEIPRPSVIRLEVMIQRPRARIKLTRREVFRRDNYTCQICGKKQSTARGKEQKVVVHHLNGIEWEKIIDYIYRHVLVNPKELQTLCPECHKQEEICKIADEIL